MTAVLSPHIISCEEYESIPEDVRNKIETYVKQQTDELMVAKALHESSKINNEQILSTLQNKIYEKGQECDSLKSKLEITTQDLEESRSKLQDVQNEVTNFRESISRFEIETSSFRHQRDIAVDERDELLKTVERRNSELERLQEDCRSLSSQLQVAVSTKCEALVKVEEIESLRLDLEFREKRMEQERERMNKEIENLTAELNKQTEELMNIRRENTTRRITLEAQLTEKIEELKIAQQTVDSLQSSNDSLHKKLEESLQKLMAQHESEQKMQKIFDQELQQQAKLIDLYKGMSEDAVVKSGKLENGIKELQKLLAESVEQYEKLETKSKVTQEDYERKLEEKVACIEELKLELKSANDLVEGIRQEKLDSAIEELSPSAATISRLLNSGMTLTQIYMQWANVSEELILEKEENKKLNEYIKSIVQEIESKAPELKKVREEHAAMVENLEQMCQTLDSTSQENNELRAKTSELKKMKEHHERENERLKAEMTDLSRQVCFLLKEVESNRCNENSQGNRKAERPCTEVTSSQVISQHLVTFSNVQELQANNQKLLALVRELSKKAEEEENEGQEGSSELKHLLDIRNKELEEAQDREKRFMKMMERAMQQLQTYKDIVSRTRSQEKESNVHEKEVEEMKVENIEPETSSKDLEPCAKHEKEIKDLTEKLQKTQWSLKELQEEMDEYRTERQTNEQILTEQMESMRIELRELRTNSSKMVSQLEYSEGRFKIMQANCTTYKTQIAALESKNKNYNTTIVKHEQSILHLQDEVLSTQKKLARAEVCLENSRRECSILRDTEARLQRERESQRREQQGQAMLLANLDTIRASLERSEVEGRARLEGRLDEALRECAALRRRLQEEQDRFRELSKHLERETEKAKSRLEEEKTFTSQYKGDIDSLKEELKKAKNELEGVNRPHDKDSSVNLQKIAEIEKLEKQVKELNVQLKCAQSELKVVQEQLSLEKTHVKRFCEVSESLETRLNDILDEYSRYKETTEKRITEMMKTEEELRRKISALESQLSSLQVGTNQSSAQLSVQLKVAQEELQSVQKEFDSVKHDLTNARIEVATLSSAVQTVEDKYAHEVVLHSADLQSLMTAKKELSEITAEINDLRSAKTEAELALELGKEGWQERESLLQSELTHVQERMKDLEDHNVLLYNQIQALGSKMAVMQAQGEESSPNRSVTEETGNRSFNTSFSEEELKSSDQLMQIIKYLRQEKNVAVGRYDLLHAENLRLQSQLESIKKQLDDAKKSLSTEKESSDVSILTAAKHTELLRKLETMNAITDSNRILRGERDALLGQIKELQLRVDSLEQELGPMRHQNIELSARIDSMDAENTALRGEAGRLRQRVNFLIERSSKTSPEDWRRLQQERESLARQVTADRDALQRKEEEARGLRHDKARIEEQLNNVNRQHQQQVEELRRQSEELGNMQLRISKLTQELNDARILSNKRNEELAKITEDLGVKETLLTDAKNKEIQIRKIAKKYKTQFEELTKTYDDDKKKMEEMEKALAEARATASTTVASTEISPEAQEQLREEGRREIEMKIVEVETKHSDKMKELVDQVTSSHEEAETLRKENDSLKTSAADKEERAKNLLKSARQKIVQLTETNKSLTQQLSDIQGRLQSAEQGKEEDSVRMTALKSQFENRVTRLEKENAELRLERQHEVEALNQRVSQLQRQLEKYQGAKPSTSSGAGEKIISETPTANIKPMAGPTSSAVKQSPTQQSVAVTPWAGRGDTPFASIRPMSVQSRTAAVLPTSQSASSTGSSATPILVAPQQQIVHTTGASSSGSDGLSSPTSSHTDYVPVPATSSASSGSSSVRQVAVPPTVTTMVPSSREETPHSAQTAAESTQDMEAEPVMSEAGSSQKQMLDASQSKIETQTQQPQAQQLQQSAQPPQQQQPQQQTQPQPQQHQQQQLRPSTPVQQILQTQQQQQQQQQSGQTSLPQPTQGQVAVVSVSQSLHTVSSNQQGQQAVAMVLPRVEQQSTNTQQIASSQVQQVEQAVAAPSSQASSSNTVTTSQAGVSSKRARDSEDENIEDDEKASQGKRSRIVDQQDMFPASSDSVLEVEYQVPTSSQRDQEDEIVDSEEEGIADEGVIEEADDGHEFDDEVDNSDGYAIEGYRDEQDLTSFEEVEGPDIDEENPPDTDNNEAEIMDDSSEVPNQSGAGSPAHQSSQEASGRLPDVQQQHAESSSAATTGAVTEIGSAGSVSVGTSQVASSALNFGRGPTRSVPPLTRQQQQPQQQQTQSQTQLLLGYEESGDDSIVPSTPTLFVPRRTDGFGEAVSSPQVPQARFTFSDTNPPATRVGVAPAASEGMDDTRMDLSQLEEVGTGRSVPTTPLQVSPQETSEIGQSEGGTEEVLTQSETQSEASGSQTTVPSITVTEASEDDAVETEEMPPPEEYEESVEQRELVEQTMEAEENLEMGEEGGDGVSSEGEKNQPMEEVEEGREAEASEPADSAEAPRRITRAANTARRSSRVPFRGQRTRGGMRPTPIIWNEPGSSVGNQPRGRACLMPSMRGSPGDQMRGNFPRGNQRGRRPRGKPKSNFNSPYQMRF